MDCDWTQGQRALAEIFLYLLWFGLSFLYGAEPRKDPVEEPGVALPAEM